MPLLFMDTGCELSSPCGSLSAGECSSGASALDREGEGNQPRPRTTKRREKNRDAARKSRRKQTERADELHQELQQLEQSNSALQKEIATLKKDLRLYETALERHRPHCRLKDSASSPAECKAGSSPPKAPDMTSLNTRVGFKTFNNPERTHHPTSSSSPKTAAASSAKLLVTSPSSSLTSSYSVPLPTHPAPHSLFCEQPLIRRPRYVPSTPAQLPTDKVQTTSAGSQNWSFTEDAFLRKPDSSLSASPSMNYYPWVPKTGLLKERGPRILPPFPPCLFSGTGMESAPQTPSVPSPAPFASIQTYAQQDTPRAKPLLSELIVPSPLDPCQTTSSSFNRSISQPAPDPSEDMSLSKLLEVNQWILSGFEDQ